MCRTRDSGIGEAFLGGGEDFLDWGGGERPRLVPSGLFFGGGGLRLRELPLRDGDEDEENDRERDLEVERDERE